MMQSEEMIKLRTQATSVMVSFVKGLIDDEKEEQANGIKASKNSKILLSYANDMVEAINGLFQ